MLCVVAFGLLACMFTGALSKSAFAKLRLRWNAAMLAAMRVRVGVDGVSSHGVSSHSETGHGTTPAPGALLLANHISWLDPIVLGAKWNLTFLANSGIAKWPLLGWLFRRSGVLFIERGRGAKRALVEISAALRAGRSVAIFPEGRTSEGRSVARFHPRLLQAAIDAGAPIQPLALRYVDAAGARVSRHTYAGRTFLGSLWAALSGRGFAARLTVFPPLPPGSRQELARRAEEMVRAAVE